MFGFRKVKQEPNANWGLYGLVRKWRRRRELETTGENAECPTRLSRNPIKTILSFLRYLLFKMV